MHFTMGTAVPPLPHQPAHQHQWGQFWGIIPHGHNIKRKNLEWEPSSKKIKFPGNIHKLYNLLQSLVYEESYLSSLKVSLSLNWPLLHKFTELLVQKKDNKCFRTILTHNTVKDWTRLYEPVSCQTCLEVHLVPWTDKMHPHKDSIPKHGP